MNDRYRPGSAIRMCRTSTGARGPYFNPGSCGPRRFDLPVTVGLLTVNEDGEFEAEMFTLTPA